MAQLLSRCRRCGGRYIPGTYGEHTRGLAHQRALALDRKIARRKARGIDKSLGRKLDPRRFTGMSNKMAALVAFILGPAASFQTKPAIAELHVVSPDLVLARHAGDIGANDVIGSWPDFLDNWGRLLDAADLTTTERRRAMYLFGTARIVDHRRSAS